MYPAYLLVICSWFVAYVAVLLAVCIVQGLKIWRTPLSRSAPTTKRKQLQAITAHPNSSPGSDRPRTSHWVSQRVWQRSFCAKSSHFMWSSTDCPWIRIPVVRCQGRIVKQNKHKNDITDQHTALLLACKWRRQSFKFLLL